MVNVKCKKDEQNLGESCSVPAVRELGKGRGIEERGKKLSLHFFSLFSPTRALFAPVTQAESFPINLKEGIHTFSISENGR